MNVNSSTTTLTFTAPSLPDGVFTGTVVVTVTAVNRLGIGPASDPATAEIEGMYYVHTYIPVVQLWRQTLRYIATYISGFNLHTYTVCIILSILHILSSHV